MPTPSVFDFDESRLAAFDQETMNKQLESQPSLYVNHLKIAQHLQGWAERLDVEALDSENMQGFIEGIRDVSAHLRQGDYLEGGALLRDELYP